MDNTQPMSLDEAVGVARKFQQQITALSAVAGLVMAADEARAVLAERQREIAQEDARRAAMQQITSMAVAGAAEARAEREANIAEGNRVAAQAMRNAMADAAKKIAVMEEDQRRSAEKAELELGRVTGLVAAAMGDIQRYDAVNLRLAEETVEAQAKLDAIRAAIAAVVGGIKA